MGWADRPEQIIAHKGYTVSYGGNAESGLTVINTGEGYEEFPDDEPPLDPDEEPDDTDAPKIACCT